MGRRRAVTFHRYTHNNKRQKLIFIHYVIISAPSPIAADKSACTAMQRQQKTIIVYPRAQQVQKWGRGEKLCWRILSTSFISPKKERTTNYTRINRKEDFSRSTRTLFINTCWGKRWKSIYFCSLFAKNWDHAYIKKRKLDFKYQNTFSTIIAISWKLFRAINKEKNILYFPVQCLDKNSRDLNDLLTFIFCCMAHVFKLLKVQQQQNLLSVIWKN